jgi:phosphatidylglycerophosphatase A
VQKQGEGGGSLLQAPESDAAKSERKPPHTHWAWAIATFFGAGYLRPGPGTYGSVAAVLLWFFAARAFHPSAFALALATTVAAIVVTAIGIPASSIVAREAHREDPGFVVIDEVAGQLVALLLTPAFGPHAWAAIALALVLFRLFDITKPPPIRRLETLRGGTGIMLDDIAAGLAALITGLILTGFAHRLH